MVYRYINNFDPKRLKLFCFLANSDYVVFIYCIYICICNGLMGIFYFFKSYIAISIYLLLKLTICLNFAVLVID